MKASTHKALRDRRREREKGQRSSRFLAWLGVIFLGTLIWLIAAAGIIYALFSQGFPSLDLIAQRYGSKPEPTRFYARDGETLLFTLAYEDFESRDLNLQKKKKLCVLIQ